MASTEFEPVTDLRLDPPNPIEILIRANDEIYFLLELRALSVGTFSSDYNFTIAEDVAYATVVGPMRINVDTDRFAIA